MEALAFDYAVGDCSCDVEAGVFSDGLVCEVVPVEEHHYFVWGAFDECLGEDEAGEGFA